MSELLNLNALKLKVAELRTQVRVLNQKLLLPGTGRAKEIIRAQTRKKLEQLERAEAKIAKLGGRDAVKSDRS